MAPSPRARSYWTRAAEITGRRIAGLPLTGGGRAQVNVAMVRSRLKRWAIEQRSGSMNDVDNNKEMPALQVAV